MTSWPDLLGYVGGTLTTLSFLPQVIKVVRSRHAGDLSLLMYLVFTAGVALWLVYGIVLGIWPIIIFNTITLALTSVILALKLRYG